MKVRPRQGKVAVAIALALCAMAPAWADPRARRFADMVEAVALVPAGTHDSEMLAKVTVAIGFIKRMAFPKAQLAVNEALQLDPRNSYLHFLNAFVYHMQSRRGDKQKAELAVEGYEQALRIDPSNWIAQEFLGLAFLELKRFDHAKVAFTEALLLTPGSARSIYGLMATSYLTGDAKTACAMADEFLKISASPHPDFLRTSVPVYASCGNFAQAAWARAALVEQAGDGPEVKRIDRRLAQWKAFYSNQQPGVIRAIQTNLSPGAGNGGMVLAQSSASSGSDQQTPTGSSSSTEDSTDTPPQIEHGVEAPAAPLEEAEDSPRMLLVDVVLVSTQEIMSTTKGVNLLSALTLQLGSTAGNLAGYSRIFSSNTPGSGDATSNTAITRAVTVPALSYSLNIANANNSLNEVLARPTLAAMENLPSEFFSGTNLSAGVVSASQQGGTTVIPVEKRFGIKLSVTPNFCKRPPRSPCRDDVRVISLSIASDAVEDCRCSDPASSVGA